MNAAIFRCLLVLISVVLVSVHARAAAPAERTNIIFVAVDDLNDWVGFLRGHPQAKTPNLDRLAKRGVAFTNAQCAAPLCCPSRAAVFSGKEPFNSGVYGNEDDIRQIAPDLVLMPQQLKSHGYRTYGAGKLLHQKRPDIFDEFFSPEQRWSPFSAQEVAYTAEELPSKATDNPRHVTKLPGGGTVVLPLNRMPSDRAPNSAGAESFDWGPVDVPDSAMGDAQIVDWAIERLRGNGASQPFFLGVGFYRPHIPLWAPAKYFGPFPVGSIKLPPYLENDLDDLGFTGRRIALEPETAGAHATVVKYKQWSAAVAAYLACVHFVDAQLGRLLDALEASPHARNTAIVIWGDHGWHLGEKQHWGKSTGWERATRVPLLIVPPARDARRFARGQTTRETVSLIDLYPTVLQFAGVPAPANGLDGKSLLPLLREPKRLTERAVVTTFQREHFSVGDDRWRYIRYADGTDELYDHRADPNEWTNLAAKPEHAAVKARLAALIPKNPKPEAAPQKKEKKDKKSGGKKKNSGD